jgi:hypothetical protein
VTWPAPKSCVHTWRGASAPPPINKQTIQWTKKKEVLLPPKEAIPRTTKKGKKEEKEKGW